MSTNGRTVTCVGIQWKAPCTSRSGLTDETTITYSGRTVKTVRRVSTTRRAQRTADDSRMTAPQPTGAQVPERDEQQERQQQHGHRRAQAEVPGEERGVVDVDGDHVRV